MAFKNLESDHAACCVVVAEYHSIIQFEMKLKTKRSIVVWCQFWQRMANKLSLLKFMMITVAQMILIFIPYKYNLDLDRQYLLELKNKKLLYKQLSTSFIKILSMTSLF